MTASAHGGLRGLPPIFGGIFGLLQGFDVSLGAALRTDAGRFLFKTYVQINQ